ncbi:oncomodulin-like isoform X2 [Hyla sarda]|nr:oncomodulin-like isoform X2 [Hyla sarda]XP_056390284.1 oncomodulin-like isoform X2 [Hyla sarda]XP_056390285.1 oncomodulin-like isoform X2 [Hyla sarda]
MSSYLSDCNIDAALNECQEPGTFKAMKFFQTSEINKLTPPQVKEIFQLLDSNGDESLDKDDVSDFLKKFQSTARPLTGQETCNFFAEGDPNQDGKIGVNEFQDMVQKSAKE